MATSIRCTHDKDKSFHCGLCPLCSDRTFGSTERRLCRVPVSPFLPDIRHNSAIVDSMRGKATELTDDTKDDCEVNTEEPSRNVTGMLQYLNVSNRMRGIFTYQKYRDARHKALKLSVHQSIHRVMERIIVGSCLVIIPIGWKQLHTSFSNTFLEDSTSRDVLAQGIKSSNKGSIEWRVLLSCLCTAAPAKDCQLFWQQLVTKIVRKVTIPTRKIMMMNKLRPRLWITNTETCLYQLIFFSYCRLRAEKIRFSSYQIDGSWQCHPDVVFIEHT